eukprot:CAMPEP_0113520158 /NCGR_PEP_ID=MMETSP0014_2-20120614/43922_1 /TAXON_ID=2857 /ORGANISM="Nitzschia sp." /LENGTH=278 /DNA_ID=CAMNT_0000417961 /DNA_START=9 /DNA_END=845 /DNA_ORIENTATION=+ /assembly_acc=CAM_ASM_000159
MGSIIGKESVAEPAFKVLLTSPSPSSSVKTMPYEIREYGKRFVAQIEYSISQNNNKDGTGTPFRALAQYIGVFGDAKNHGNQKIDMTAPVSMQQQQQNSGGSSGQGTKIAMTAPVAMQQRQDQNCKESDSDPTGSTTRVMKFFLPADYKDISEIPVPTNPDIKIVEIPPGEVGAVHRFSGTYSNDSNDQIAIDLMKQLRSDMMMMDDEDATTGNDDLKSLLPDCDDVGSIKSQYQFFGYNPPFCLPMFRRNEVWIPLTKEQVERLVFVQEEQNKTNEQ